jgi:hypothetical protein
VAHPWVSKGIQAVNLMLPGVGNRYCCPLCLKLVSDLDTLTIEHVPAACAGGVALVVTCRDCNNRAGYELEHHVARVQRLARFAAGEEPIDIGFEVAGTTVPATATLSGDTFLVVGAPDRTDPKRHAAVFAELDRVARDQDKGLEGKIHFRIGPYSATRERVAWLKAAYLAAFAAFGYRYILRPILEPVRKQLREPDSPGVAASVFFLKEAVTGTRQLVIVREPARLRSVLVIMDNCHAYLPAFDPSPTFWADLDAAITAEKASGGTTYYSGSLVPWPTEPGLVLDYQMAASDRATPNDLP